MSFGNFKSSLSGVSDNVRNVTREVGSLGLKLTAVSGVVGWAFKRQFVDTAAQFEQYRTLFTSLEGSEEKGKRLRIMFCVDF